MRILHYSLGLPPYRSGGLTRYCKDLCIEQAKDCTNTVFLLYPERRTLFRRKLRIVHARKYNGIYTYKILNPLPVPINMGVRAPLKFRSCKIDTRSIMNFFEETKPEIIHVHTFMGLPEEFLNIAKEQNIRIVYTTHDYYGLCFRTNFIRGNTICKSPEDRNCAMCNSNAAKLTHLYLFNEPFFHLSLFKKLPALKNIGKKVPDKEEKTISTKEVQEYELLSTYYKRMFALIDCFHFNSSVSRQVFSTFLNGINGVLIHISHFDIKDNRRIRTYGDRLRIGFIGSPEPYKGLQHIEQALQAQESTNWELHVWGGQKRKSKERIHYNGKFSSSGLSDVYNKIDMLVVPSICKETFSFVTLEALSYAIPTLVSKNVGAKDIVQMYNSDFVYEDLEDLKKKLNTILIHRELLQDFNKKICEEDWNYSIKKHSNDIQNILYQSGHTTS